MAVIEWNILDICPALKGGKWTKLETEDPVRKNALMIEIDPERETEKGVYCGFGGDFPSAELISDLYKETDPIKFDITCAGRGCRYLPGGFK